MRECTMVEALKGYTMPIKCAVCGDLEKCPKTDEQVWAAARGEVQPDSDE